MFKRVALCLAVVAVSGCDINLSSLRPVKWATVDVNKVREAVKDEVAAENPYPAELETVRDWGNEYVKIRSQIADLTSAASNNCMKKYFPSTDNNEKRSFIHQSAQARLPQQFQQSDSTAIGYQECIRLIDSDQLISDLTLKLATYDKLRQERQMHENKVTQKSDKRAREAVAEYGKKNGYDLIIEERGTGAVYNASDMVVDVTGGVVESVKR